MKTKEKKTKATANPEHDKNEFALYIYYNPQEDNNFSGIPLNLSEETILRLNGCIDNFSEPNNIETLFQSNDRVKQCDSDENTSIHRISPRRIINAHQPKTPTSNEIDLLEILYNTASNNISDKKIQLLPIDIYIDTNTPHEIFRVYYETTKLIKALQFEICGELPDEKGSWYKRMVAKSKKLMTDKEVTDRLREVEYALEVKVLKDQSEIDVNQSQALSNVLASIKEIPNACIKVGSLLIIKTTSIEGTISLIVRSLTIVELHMLNKRPDLLKQPNAILDFLSMSDNNNDYYNRADTPPTEN